MDTDEKAVEAHILGSNPQGQHPLFCHTCAQITGKHDEHNTLHLQQPASPLLLLCKGDQHATIKCTCIATATTLLPYLP